MGNKGCGDPRGLLEVVAGVVAGQNLITLSSPPQGLIDRLAAASPKGSPTLSLAQALLVSSRVPPHGTRSRYRPLYSWQGIPSPPQPSPMR